ncbi:MAG: glycosyltransferase family A protein [Bacteroidales bacterium]|nr:glycosyltransferase family A protein [Bacteroidales bacterium]MDD3430675.1 glycosyltransferase family A protein [Bacteroidales bacterium]MDD4361369.1 glycosyltransferase family A protein [Bacteroidales bacterium]MDD4430481.1 glycosyltransferase family A protein [Bacteroidales bacterium]
MEGPEISVFIPVYNGSLYLRPTLDSVLNQSFSDFELLVVDDSSTDDSWMILQDYAARDPRMRILQKEHGGNVPKSWNVVRPLFRGEFVFYLSQDDLLSPDCFEQMIRRQQECNADCVLPDMLRFKLDPLDAVEEHALIAPNADYSRTLDGRSAFLLSLDWSIHGFMLCRRQFYAEEEFDENTFNSDEYVSRKIFLQSSLVAFSKGRFFYRRGNSNSITDPGHPLRYQVLRTNRRLLQLMLEQGFEQQETDACSRQVFDAFCGLYTYFLQNKHSYPLSEQSSIKTLFKEEYAAINKYKKVLVSAYRHLSFKQRIRLVLMLSAYSLFVFINTWSLYLKKLNKKREKVQKVKAIKPGK